MLLRGAYSLGSNHVHHSFLERSGNVRDRYFFAVGLEMLHTAGDCSLQPREREVMSVLAWVFNGSHKLWQCQPTRESERLSVAFFGCLIDCGTTRVTET